MMKAQSLQSVVESMSETELDEFAFDNYPESTVSDLDLKHKRQYAVDYCKSKKISGKKLYIALYGLDSVSEKH